MKRILWLILLSYVCFSQPVGIDVARDAAEFYFASFQNSDFWEQAEYFSIGDFEILYHRLREDAIVGFVFHFEPSGFVVISSDKRTEPLTFYSTKSRLSTQLDRDNIPMLFVQSDLEARYDYLQEANLTKSLRVAQNSLLWLKIEHSEALYSPMTVYGPLLDFPTWHQNSPFNDDCPEFSGHRCVTGCVATALAQICNYFEHPPSVSFTEADSYWSNRTSPSIWIEAPPASMAHINYNGRYPSDVVKAQLSYAAGVSVRMQYHPVSSAASLRPGDFTDKWQYAYARKVEWGDADYISSLQNSIIAGIPCPMSISYMDGGFRYGHKVIADGYNTGTNAYRLNFGWGGHEDGWYVLPSGLPSPYETVEDAIVEIQVPGYAVHHVPGDFPNIQAALDAATGLDTVIVADGIWTGAGNNNLNFNGKGIYLRSQNGPFACTINLAGSTGFIINTGETRRTVIDGFNIINGSSDRGGAINVSNFSNPTVRNCIFRNNNASSFGGAVYILSGNLLFENCIFIENSSWGGGAVYAGRNQDFINCTFYNNSGTRGGAIYAVSRTKAVFINSIFRSNTATDGNDIYMTNPFEIPPEIFFAYCNYNPANIFQDGGTGTVHTGAGNINIDPDFIDSYCRQSSTSPVNNSGIGSLSVVLRDDNTLYTPAFDIEGWSRPQSTGFDMGAYEWSSMTAIEEQSQPDDFNITISPNPFNSAVTIKAPKHATIRIYSSDSRLIHQLPRNTNRWKPDDKLPSGAYIVAIDLGDTIIKRELFYIK